MSLSPTAGPASVPGPEATFVPPVQRPASFPVQLFPPVSFVGTSLSCFRSPSAGREEEEGTWWPEA